MKAKFIPLLAFFLLFCSCIQDQEEGENYIEVNDKLPEFTVENVAGEELHSRDLLVKVTLLVFFVTACEDCRRELPKIEKIWNTLKENSDFQLIPISRSETAARVETYWKEDNFTMPFYLDSDKKIFSLFAKNTIPRIYLVNQENIVVWMAVEMLPFSIGELVGKIEETIKK